VTASLNPDSLLTTEQRRAILQTLLPFSPRLIYLFGSAARGELRPDSDFDLAVLTENVFPPADRYRCSQNLGVTLNRDVDLVDLRNAPEALRIQIIRSGIPFHIATEQERAVFEMRAFSDYARLNEERKPVVTGIRETGRVYGR
jgi:predicted nucleotidyltransferase